VDDHSPYDVAALLQEFRDPRLRLLRQRRNVGMQRNWRTALCTPTTRYVAFLEDDNLWLPHHLGTAVDALKRHPDTIFYGCASEYFGSRQGVYRAPWCEDDDLHLCRWQEMGYAGWLRGCPVMASSVVVRRDALQELFWGGKSWPWCHDYLWWGQLACKGPFLFDGRVGVRYRWHDTNATFRYINSRGNAHWLYVLRELAKRAYRAGGLRDLPAETRDFSAGHLSILVIALSAPESPPGLRRQARQLFEARRDLATDPGCARNYRIAARLGAWWLHWADLQTRLLGRWWPVPAW
jgi:glycosyltransferase involved in cell wall biosynthesis